jgi:hypothetical protein
MKAPQENTLFFFVDESGDPYFYDRTGTLAVGKEGCSKILLLGFVRTEEPDSIRKVVLRLQAEISGDRYLSTVPSVKKSTLAFHATDDCPEVRERVFKAIVDLPFKSEFIVARKLESVFKARHKKSPNLFYDDLVTKLFQNQLHHSKQNIVYYAMRGIVRDRFHWRTRSRRRFWHLKNDGKPRWIPKLWCTRNDLRVSRVYR